MAEASGGGDRLVIGRMDDIKPEKLGPGEYTLPQKGMPDQGSPKANWKQNDGMLREEMRNGKPIRDASPQRKKGDKPNFTDMERNRLKDKGWTLDGDTWIPPRGGQ